MMCTMVAAVDRNKQTKTSQSPLSLLPIGTNKQTPINYPSHSSPCFVPVSLSLSWAIIANVTSVCLSPSPLRRMSGICVVTITVPCECVYVSPSLSRVRCVCTCCHHHYATTHARICLVSMSNPTILVIPLLYECGVSFVVMSTSWIRAA